MPPETELTARHEEIPAWDDMPDELKPVLARQMEVYAGFLEHTDHHVGRLVDALEDLGVLEDTLVYYIIGDNGASAEGTVQGTFNEMIMLNGAAALETTEFMASHIDEFGTPRGLQPLRGRLGARDGHALPVDEAGRLALGRHAQRHDRALAERDHGAGRGPLAVPPRDRRRADGSRGCRLPQPTVGRRRRAASDRGRRACATRSTAPPKPTGATTQYFEMFCNRGIYHEGWTAVTRHSTPWVMTPSCLRSRTTSGSSTTRPDWSQAHDLAAEMPEKLAELQQLWLDEARKYNVLPLDDRRIERFNSDLAGRPTLVKGNSQLLFGGMGRLTENTVDQHQEQVARGDGRGRRSGQGRRGRDHRPGRRLRRLEPVREGRQADLLLQPARPAALQGRGRRADPGRQSTRCGWSSPTTAAGSAKGGTVTLYVDGTQVGEGRVEGTVPMVFSADETTRRRLRHRLARQRRLHGETSRFTGTVELGADRPRRGRRGRRPPDHPEERLRVAMARQ